MPNMIEVTPIRSMSEEEKVISPWDVLSYTLGITMFFGLLWLWLWLAS